MAFDDKLAPFLAWRPHPVGDPGPEVYLLFAELDRARQIQVVTTLIEARVKIAEATAQAYKQIGTIASKLGG